MRHGLFESGAAIECAAFARIAIERGVDHPDGLTYGVPASMPGLRVGDRVEAPLGRGDSIAPGYVVEFVTKPDLDPARIKPLKRATGERLPETLIHLARWMSRYYTCPLGIVLGTMAPAAVKKGVGGVTRTMVRPTGAEPPERMTPAVRAAWGSMQAARDRLRFPMEARRLADAIGERTIGPINKLLALGMLEEVRVRTVRAAWDEEAPALAPAPIRLTQGQGGAVENISAALGSFSTHLLRGVTGSGKTEVYLRVLERAVERGECAIVLVPEISLTPQTASRFLARFRDVGVAVLHSGLTQAQRNQQWWAVANGEARIVVGARSAVFAPFPARVGLIVVDEEHDNSYKQDQQPRYHARDVAIKRAQLENCPVVLGSATPSLESWRNAREGRYELHELTERPAGMRMPRVRVVDLADERRARPWTENRVRLLGPTLENALRRTLDEGGQAILLLNRRGYANYVCCPDHNCGWTLTCDDCDATMVFHKDRNLPKGGVVRCHHCLAEKLLPEKCPVCQRKVSVFGLGTQRVEEEIAREVEGMAPGSSLLRLDSDTMRRGRDYFRALERFRTGEARVLLGTQMVAKGLDFPGVRLVGVVHADTAINLPDFRAAERTFQLVSQVAGRAGRSEQAGEVIVQTLAPHAPAIRFAAAHDYEGFAEDELAQRKEAGLPPFARMARIVVRDADHEKAWERADKLARALARLAPRGVRVQGPMPCPLSRVAGKHRIALELLAPTAGPLQEAMTALRNEGLVKSDASAEIDVDPTSLL